MTNLIVELSKYLMIMLFAGYTYECFSVLGKRRSAETQERIFGRQTALMYLLHLNAFAVMYAVTNEASLLVFYLMQVLLVTVILNCYRIFYPASSRLVANNMCMLLLVGFIILTRLNQERAMKQFVIAAASMVLNLIIPLLIRKIRFFHKLTWLYAAVGVVLLALVAVAGSTSYGAKLSFTVAGITIQPSEFIKIVFVFFVAARLSVSTSFKDVAVTSLVAALHGPDPGCLQGSGRRADLFCGLSGNAVCGNQEAVVSFCRACMWKRRCSGGLWSVQPCTGPGFGVEDPAERH